MKITEKIIIDNYLRPLTFKNKESLNLLDDVYFDKKKKIVFSTDTFIEGKHFLYASKPEKFVKKIFRATISDILCKGAKPTVYFLSLGINKTNKKWLQKLKKELYKESKKFGIFLGGGDTVNSKNTTITISVIGKVKKSPILRSGAKVNDDIYITGNLGDSYLGLLLNLKKKNFNNLNNYFKKQYCSPNLPLQFSQKLDIFASSSMDISDGLIVDLQNLCRSSSCGANIFFDKIPLSNNARKVSFNNKIKKSDIFLSGDDYQLLFTSQTKNRDLIKRISKTTKTKITCVGKIIHKKIINLHKGDKIIDLNGVKNGYIHTF